MAPTAAVPAWVEFVGPVTSKPPGPQAKQSYRVQFVSLSRSSSLQFVGRTYATLPPPSCQVDPEDRRPRRPADHSPQGATPSTCRPEPPTCHLDRRNRQRPIRPPLVISKDQAAPDPPPPLSSRPKEPAATDPPSSCHLEAPSSARSAPHLSSRPKDQAAPGPQWRDLGEGGWAGVASAGGRAGGRSPGNGALLEPWSAPKRCQPSCSQVADSLRAVGPGLRRPPGGVIARAASIGGWWARAMPRGGDIRRGVRPRPFYPSRAGGRTPRRPWREGSPALSFGAGSDSFRRSGHRGCMINRGESHVEERPMSDHVARAHPTKEMRSVSRTECRSTGGNGFDGTET